MFNGTQTESAMASKEAYQRKWEAQLNVWDAKLDQLRAKAQKATADVRIDYENELESLKHKREEAHKALAALADRSESAWEEMKDGAEKVWDDMRKAMEKVAARFK
jgi:hypothetical protein